MTTTPEIEHAGKDGAASFTLADKTPHLPHRSYGEYLSDKIATTVGSWHFIIIQSSLSPNSARTGRRTRATTTRPIWAPFPTWC